MTRDTLNRFYVYNALLTRQFDKPVITYIIYMGRAKIGGQVIENDCVSFRPKVMKVYEMDARNVVEKAKIAKANLIEMALMPLMKNSNEEEIVELIDEEAKMKIGRDLRDDIITCTLVMTSTVYDEELVDSLKGRLRRMYDVDIFEKERKEATEKGKLEGKLETLKDTTSKLLIAKFKSEYTKDLREKVKNSDIETLEYIADHIFDISLDEVKKIL